MARESVRLVRGREVWPTITRLVRQARRTYAAIAYFGRNANDLLPLKKGDVLVVDMSPAAVKQGVTDPFELRKLVERDVTVATRAHLHAKLIVAGNWLVAGSMNVSRNSAQVLDEAAIVTNAPDVVRRARETILRWSNEPVLPMHLEEAERAYRPPTFKAAVLPTRQMAGKRAAKTARAWIVGGLVYSGLPEAESARADRAEETALQGFKRRRETSIDYVHYARRPRYFDAIRTNDWVIKVVRDEVFAPARVVKTVSYPRGAGNRRWLLVLEEREAPISKLRELQRAFKRRTGVPLPNGRTRALTDDDVADQVLALWSPLGKPIKRLW